MMRLYHPDVSEFNPSIAMQKAKEVNEAYSGLKQYLTRKNLLLTFVGGINFDIEFFGIKIRTYQNQESKEKYIQAQKDFSKQPSNILFALDLIYWGCINENYSEIKALLIDKSLIKTISYLFTSYENEIVYHVILRWYDILFNDNKYVECLYLLDEIINLGKLNSEIKVKITLLYYQIAKGYIKFNNKELCLDKKIKYLQTLIKLDIKLDYIYKNLAELFYKKGDINKARIYLSEAYKINPNLSGAKKISMRLGFS